MKAVAIFLILLCVVAVVGVAYVYASSNLTVAFVECIATDPVTQSDYFTSLKNQLSEGTFTGIRFTKDDLKSPEDYLFYTWTVRLENNTFLPAEVAEIQVTPMTGDLLQIGDPDEHSVPAKREGVLSATVLTARNMHNVREAIVTWYFWGLPFSARVTLGR